MTRSILALAAALMFVSTVAPSHAKPAEDGWVAPGDTIVDVRGDAANGFSITHLDGTELFPPTRSESLAECEEYDTMRARVRCRTEVRVWFRDLADMRRTLRWVRSQS